MLFGALDEMATNWMLSHRRSSLDGVADAVIDLFVTAWARPRRKEAAAVMRTAAVLGAGTMGAQIAAHVANAGVRVLLLDVISRRRPRRA